MNEIKNRISENIPINIGYVLNELNKNGYEAGMVGGCIRDIILGIKPHDYDITTSATPQQVMEIFKDKQIIETGIQYGTVTVMIDHEPIEVTTFRKDSNYSDGRRPDEVTFSNNIQDDLSRRDFTMNAIYYSLQNGLYDPFNGIMDIQSKVIRCVGNADDRFKEDALRVLRAIRFISKYDLSDYFVKSHCINNMNLIKNVSQERIYKEFKQIYSSNNSLKGHNLLMDCKFFDNVDLDLDINVNRIKKKDTIKYMLNTFDNIKLNSYNNKFVIAMVVLFQYKDINTLIKDLKKFKFSNKESKAIHLLLQQLTYQTHTIIELKSIMHNVIDYSEEFFLLKTLFFYNWHIKYTSFSIEETFKISTNESESYIAEYKRIKRDNEVLSISELCINGNDLISLGYKQNAMLKDILSHLLYYVYEDNSRNTKKDLIKKASEMLFITQLGDLTNPINQVLKGENLKCIEKLVNL